MALVATHTPPARSMEAASRTWRASWLRKNPLQQLLGGLHFYTLNRSQATEQLLERVFPQP